MDGFHRMEPILYIGIGLVLGLVIGWLLGARRAAPADQRVEAELREQYRQSQAELSQIRAQLSEATNARAAAEASRQAADLATAENRRARENAESVASRQRDELGKINTTLAATAADLKAARDLLENERAIHERAMQEMRASQERSLADLQQAFKALSLEALKATQPEFLQLAKEMLGKFQEAAKGDLAARQEAIAGVVKPLQESLRTYQERLQQSESAQSSALGEVKNHLESLAKQSESLAAETQQFRMVLKSAPARGRWGEETLRRVVEAAGMSAHCDFDVQVQMDDKKPDLLVKLPGDRMIIVDAKVPEFDFLAALDEADPARRTELLAEHAAKLKETIKELARRDYPKTFANALDYVVLFLPAESLFSAALEGDRDLIVWAAERRILLATPASLIALLRSVSITWLHHNQTQNAREIADAAREFYGRVCTLAGHFEDIGQGLNRATGAFNKAVGSYDRMVRPSGERLKTLGGGDTAKILPEVDSIEQTLRLPEPPAPAS